MRLNSDTMRALEFMELNLILGKEFETYSQFYSYAKSEYNMSAESLLSRFSFVELAKLILLADKFNMPWVLTHINSPVVVNGVPYKTKRKLLYDLNLTQKEFFKRLLDSEGDLAVALQPKSNVITFLGKVYNSHEELFKIHSSSVPDLKKMQTPFETMEEYLQYLEETHVCINGVPLLSMKQLCLHVRSLSELLIPAYKHYRKNGTLEERQSSFDELLERFHKAQKEYMRDSGSDKYGTVADFAKQYNRTPVSIMKLVYAPQPYYIIAMSLRFGESYNLKLNNYNRKLIYQNDITDFNFVCELLGLSAEQLEDIVISGFNNEYVEQRLKEIAWKKGLYNFDVRVVDNELSNLFLDELYKS